MYVVVLPGFSPAVIDILFVLRAPPIMLARKDVSEIHSLVSHAVVPVRMEDVYTNDEKPAPLTDTLTDPVVAVLPHLCELRVACIKMSMSQ